MSARTQEPTDSAKVPLGLKDSESVFHKPEVSATGPTRGPLRPP